MRELLRLENDLTQEDIKVLKTESDILNKAFEE